MNNCMTCDKPLAYNEVGECVRCVSKPATLSAYLRQRYSREELEDMAEDGCNFGGQITRELYNEYYSCIWSACIREGYFPIDQPNSIFNHTDFARYMLSHAVRYYCNIILVSRED